ncbi:MAG TPA: serine/threonine-protein kinase [Gemmataceae bacterium]|nr:serine/threonine-protein kinase [Gemmataceae bacterium]
MNERSIFVAALEKDSPAERAAYLDEACGGEAALRQRVEELLRAHVRAGGILDLPAAGPTTDSYGTMNEDVGSRIGPYKLLQKIGEGGFGVVYMAEQMQPVRRKVAFKIIKPGMDTKEVIARFESERQALALMDHPNIARVLDAGETASGRPYFVMELVKGVPINEFCDKNNVPTPGRLDLFMTVCRAVQHAHHKGIIHRDLKPSNIMITLHDGQPVPKVIDFGVAKATNQQLTERTLFTSYGQIIGTPAYMSPEQAELSGLDIDTRSDIYSLGVLLYELLTGTTPFDGKRLRQAGYVEMQRIICEEEPPKPSTRLTSMGDRATMVSSHRSTDLQNLTALLKGDLDWIVMKALEKDRNRRYDTPNSFAADIERFLRHEAILARAPSRAYKLRKFAQRNKTAVATATFVAALLLLGTLISTWQAVRARQAERTAAGERDAAVTARAAEAYARREAEEERNRALAAEKRAKASEEQAKNDAASARAVNDFLHRDLLSQADVGNQTDPDQKPDRDIKLRTVLDRASRSIAGKFKEQPLVEASIRQTIGQTYLALGENGAAQAHLELALEMRSQALGEQHADTLTSMNDLAHLYWSQRRFARAEPILSKALEIKRRVRGEDDGDTLSLMNNLALLYLDQREYAKASKLFPEVLEGLRRVQGEEGRDTLACMNNLALLYQRQGQYARAEPLFIKVLDGYRKLLGEENRLTLNTMHILGVLYCSQREYAKAEPMLTKGFEVRRRVLGEEHPDVLTHARDLVILYQAQGQYAKAEPLARKVLESQRRKQESDPRELSAATSLLGYNLLKVHRYAEAEPLLRECLKMREEQLPDEWGRFNAESMLGESLLGQKKYVAAEPLLLSGHKGMKEREAKIPVFYKTRLTEALERLVEYYTALGQSDKAVEWRKKLEGSMSAQAKKP